MTGYGLNDRYSILVRIKYVSLPHHPQNNIGVHPTFYPMGTADSFQPRGQRDHSAEIKNEWSFTTSLTRSMDTGNCTLHIKYYLEYANEIRKTFTLDLQSIGWYIQYRWYVIITASP
jgi:hypothetical protein